MSAIVRLERDWRRGICCLLVAAASAASVVASQRAPVESDQDILVRLERQWNDAFYRGDVEVLDRLLADEFIATYDNGSRGDKERELALAATFAQQVTSAVQDDFIVRVYRDAAVVWFTLRVTGIRQGQPVEETLQYTDVWVFRDERWQCVSSHSTGVRAQ